MARSKKDEGSESAEVQNESVSEVGKQSKLKDPFDGETYTPKKDIASEYKQDIDKEPNILKKSEDEFDAIDPMDVPEPEKEKSIKDKVKNKKPDVVKYIKHDDGLDGDDNVEDGEPKEDLQKEDEGEVAEEESDFNSELIERAVNIGMQEEDINAFTSEKELRKHLTIIEAVMKRESRTSNADEEIPADKKSDENNTGKSNAEKLKLDLSEDIFEPKVVETLNKLNDHYHGVVESLTDEVKTLKDFLVKKEVDERETNQKKHEISVFNEFQSQIEKLVTDKENGSFFESELGKGQIKNKTPQYNKRSKLWEEFTLVARIDAERGGNATVEDLFKKAVKLTYADSSMKIAKTELGNKLKLRKNLITERVSSRDPGDSGLTPEQKAYKNAKAKVRGFTEE